MASKLKNDLRRFTDKLLTLGSLGYQLQQNDAVISKNLQAWPARGEDLQKRLREDLKDLYEFFTEVGVAAAIDRENQDAKEVFFDRVGDMTTLNMSVNMAKQPERIAGILSLMESDYIEMTCRELPLEDLMELIVVARAVYQDVGTSSEESKPDSESGE